MLRRIVFLATLLAAIAAIAPAAVPAKPESAGPPLATPPAALQHALTCNGSLAGTHRDPVLLIHGTFADSEINWAWNYKEVLPTRGETACTVDLPDRSVGDIQVSTEYVVYAIRAMARQSHRQVALISHSQGGLEARWALRFWPDLRRLVSDAILFVPPNNGSAFPDGFCTAPGACTASLYQMRTGSNFLTALNAGQPESYYGIPFTVIATADDTVFVTAQQAALHASGRLIKNIVIQDLCPDHHVDHNGVVFDGPTYAITVDALDHRGPADPSRVDAAVCQTDTMPGTTRDEANAKLAAYGATLAELLGPNGPKAQGEPALACYVTRTCPPKCRHGHRH
jgi:pimeloyl-ACP methyl ester carboxylesterase